MKLAYQAPGDLRTKPEIYPVQVGAFHLINQPVRQLRSVVELLASAHQPQRVSLRDASACFSDDIVVECNQSDPRPLEVYFTERDNHRFQQFQTFFQFEDAFFSWRCLVQHFAECWDPFAAKYFAPPHPGVEHDDFFQRERANRTFISQRTAAVRIMDDDNVPVCG